MSSQLLLKSNIIEKNDKIINDISDISDISNEFNTLISSLTIFKNQLSNFQTQIKKLDKKVKKIYIITNKKNKSKQPKIKKPSGFAKPTKVTNELCNFMGKEEGSEIARTDVTKALISYIDTHKLQNNENKQIIIPDTKLKLLLGLDDNNSTIITYFNIQQHMNKHFSKNKELTI